MLFCCFQSRCDLHLQTLRVCSFSKGQISANQRLLTISLLASFFTPARSQGLKQNVSCMSGCLSALLSDDRRGITNSIIEISEISAAARMEVTLCCVCWVNLRFFRRGTLTKQNKNIPENRCETTMLSENRARGWS